MQDKTLRLRVFGECEAEKVRDLSLVPAQQWRDFRQAWHRAVRLTAPYRERNLSRHGPDIPQLNPAGLWIPSIEHLHPSAALEQLAGGILQRGRMHLFGSLPKASLGGGLRYGHCAALVKALATAMK